MNVFFREDRAKKLIVSYKADKEFFDMLEKLELEYIITKKLKTLQKPVDDHPDMVIHPISKNKLIVEKTLYDYYKKILGEEICLIKSEDKLKEKYPDDILLNVSRVDDMFFHKKDFIDKKLRQELIDLGLKEIFVNQGYSRCSTMVIGENIVITQDYKLHKTYIKNNIKSYLIPFGGISLPGYDTGFIGGSCGMINSKELIFYGDIDRYIHGDILKRILKENDISYNCPKDIDFIDRGSIIAI